MLTHHLTEVFLFNPIVVGIKKHKKHRSFFPNALVQQLSGITLCLCAFAREILSASYLQSDVQ